MSSAPAPPTQSGRDTADPRSLPLFMAYCPDYPTISHSSTSVDKDSKDKDKDKGKVDEGDTYAKRLSVRQRHWERAQDDKASGRLFFGLGYLPPASSPLLAHPLSSPTTPSGPPPMAGSLMLMHYPDISAMWDRIKSDVYWTEGVWDKEHVRVHEFIPMVSPLAADNASRAGVAGVGQAGGAREPEAGAEDAQ